MYSSTRRSKSYNMTGFLDYINVCRRLTVKRFAYASCTIISLAVFYHTLPRFTQTDEETVRLKFKESAKNHRLRSLTSQKMKLFAEMSDISQFGSVYLRPFMRKRVPGTTGHKLVQQHIIAKMQALGWSVEEDPFTDRTPYGDKEFNNIIATQNPATPRTLTLACHFDSKYFEKIDFIGATDSAVPCAMLLDLGKRLNQSLWTSTSKHVNDISLQFIFFDGEEAFHTWTNTDSIYGARHLAKKMLENRKYVEREVSVRQIETMDALVLLDLIGASNPQFRSWFSETQGLFRELQNIELRLAKLGQLHAHSKSSHSNKYFMASAMTGGGIQDDHIPFLNNGVPVLHLIAYPFPQVWHKEEDNESNLDFNSIDDINKILRVFVAEYLYLSP